MRYKALSREELNLGLNGISSAVDIYHELLDRTTQHKLPLSTVSILTTLLGLTIRLLQGRISNESIMRFCNRVLESPDHIVIKIEDSEKGNE